MLDEYFDLFTKLEAKQAADSDRERQNIRQDIKRIADRLKKQTQTPETVFDASFCYYVAGYYFQAKDLVGHFQIDNAHVIQQWILHFLEKDFEKLSDEISAIAYDAGFRDSAISEEIDSGKLSQSEVVELIIKAKIAEGLLDIVSFIETGNDEKPVHALKIFLSCQKLLCKEGEWQIWWWVECLKLITEEFVENSLWQALKPMREDAISSDMISKYIVANYKASKIIEFWRTQTECLPSINAPERYSFCLSVPTSAGKTKAAELAVLRFLLDYWNEPDAKCVYIAPLRKLCQEVEESFSKVFKQFQSGIVSLFYGGQEIDVFDEYFFKRSRILIVTPEKLDGMLRQHPDLASQIKLVIADEGHLIGEQDHRQYRFLLERLIYILQKRAPDKTNKSRIILISGVLPNIKDFAELISGSRENVVEIDWRPVDEPQIGSWIWDGTRFNTTKPELPVPIPFPMNSCESKDKFEEYVVRTAIQCAMMSATMVFSANRTKITEKGFLDLLQCIVQNYPELFRPSEPLPRALKKYPEHFLLENGIAIHHKYVPSEIKSEIEKRINNGNIRLLFASPTLAQGVNIPFDTVLIYSLQHGYFNPISDAVFWNVVGRVGRPISQIKKTTASLEAPKVVFLLNKAPTAKFEDRQNVKRSNELIDMHREYRVKSPFLDFLNEIRRITTDLPIPNLVSELAEKPNLHDIIGEMASYPWRGSTLEKYLIQLDNQLFDLLHENYPDVDITLDWLQQLVKELVDLFVKASVIKTEDLDYITDIVLARLQFIAKISKEKRRQDYLLGLPYDDCEKIKQNVEELLVWYYDCIGLFNNNRDSGMMNFVNLINFVCDLSICPHKTNLKTSKQDLLPNFDPNPKETARKQFYTDWLSGADHAILQKSLKLFCPKKDFSQYLQFTIEREIPWGVSAIARYLSAIVKDRGLSLLPDLEYLPAMVKYGTNSKVACHLMRMRRLPIPRKYAIPIAELYRSKLSWDENNESGEIFYRDFENAIKSLQSLTDEEMNALEIDASTNHWC